MTSTFYTVQVPDSPYQIAIYKEPVDMRVKRIVIRDATNGIYLGAKRKGVRTNRWWPYLRLIENTPIQVTSNNVSFFECFVTEEPQEVIQKLVELLQQHILRMNKLKEFTEQLNIENHISHQL